MSGRALAVEAEVYQRLFIWSEEIHKNTNDHVKFVNDLENQGLSSLICRMLAEAWEDGANQSYWDFSALNPYRKLTENDS